MAPIGLLTAIVSAIRVCGHSSLCAFFIGRSQEGDGVVEAELCTSTSRDVCELFNRGGITRVLGNTRVLELIYLPGKGLTEPRAPEKRETDPFRFGDFLERFKDNPQGWREARRGGLDVGQPRRTICRRRSRQSRTSLSMSESLSALLGFLSLLRL